MEYTIPINEWNRPHYERVLEIEKKIKELKQESEIIECSIKSYLPNNNQIESSCWLCGKKTNGYSEYHHLLMTWCTSKKRSEYTVLLCKDCHIRIHCEYRNLGFQWPNSQDKENMYEMIDEYFDLKLLQKIVQYYKRSVK